MYRLISLRCQGCGRGLQVASEGAAEVKCGVCGSSLYAVGKLELPHPSPKPAGQRSAPGMASSADLDPNPWQRRRRLALYGLLGLLGLLGVGTEVGFLEAGRRADEEQLANGRAAAKVEAARELLSAQRWDEAVALLHDALATPGATDLAKAEQVLLQVRPARVASLLPTAAAAVEQKNLAKARGLLQAYLAEPGAPDKDRALHLQRDLDLATSADKAAQRLRQLPEAALASFAAGGRPAALNFFPDRALQEIYVATLKARLGPEQQRRADLREAQLKSQALIRATAAYKELLRFVEASRQSRARSQGDPRLFAYLFKELNVTDPAEQTRTVAELTGPPPEMAALEQSIARERIALKERFRSYAGFDQPDQESFEQIVDQALDRLAAELRGAKTP